MSEEWDERSVRGVGVIKVSEERGESNVRGAAGKPVYLDKPGHRGPEDDVRDLSLIHI